MRFNIEINPSLDGGENSTHAGMAQSAFDPDTNTFKIFVDWKRVPDVRSVPGIVGHEIAHMLLDVLKLWQQGRHPSLESTIHDYITSSIASIGTAALAPLPLEVAIAKAKTRRYYTVMVRRSVKLFNSSSVEAASAQEAVDMARKATWSDRISDYEHDDADIGAVEWAHAETAEGDEPDHADWEKE